MRSRLRVAFGAASVRQETGQLEEDFAKGRGDSDAPAHGGAAMSVAISAGASFFWLASKCGRVSLDSSTTPL